MNALYPAANRHPTAAVSPEEDDDDAWEEQGPDPEHPNWDDFDLDDDEGEPEPDDGDFWIDPDQFADPWN
jgi:hypothetical protein